MTMTLLTVADLDAMAKDDTKRYELIEGVLYVSSAPHPNHQRLSYKIAQTLYEWSKVTGAGEMLIAAGVVFGPRNGVVPDVLWVSAARRAAVFGADGTLDAAPDLVVEVLSPGSNNEERDRVAKFGLYARQGVREYWIAGYRERFIDIYRYDATTQNLVWATTLYEPDTLTSPILPGFACPVADLYTDLT